MPQHMQQNNGGRGRMSIGGKSKATRNCSKTDSPPCALNLLIEPVPRPSLTGAESTTSPYLSSSYNHGQEMRSITDKISKALQDIDDMYVETASHDELLNDIVEQTEILGSGQLKSQLKQFIQKYKGVSGEVENATSERDEILYSLADWFSASQLSPDVLEGTGEEHQSKVRDTVVTTKMKFDKLKCLQEEIDMERTRGRNIEYLEREKDSLKGEVIESFKACKTAVTTKTAKQAGQDGNEEAHIWKYAAGEIMTMLSKVRTEGTDVLEELQDKLDKMVKVLNENAEKQQMLQEQLKQLQLSETKWKKENVALTDEKAYLNDKVERFRKELKKTRKTLQKHEAVQDKHQWEDESHADIKPETCLSLLTNSKQRATQSSQQKQERVCSPEKVKKMESEMAELTTKLTIIKQENSSLEKQLRKKENLLVTKTTEIENLNDLNNGLLEQIENMENSAVKSPPAQNSEKESHETQQTLICQKCQGLVVSSSETDIHRVQSSRSSVTIIENITKSYQSLQDASNMDLHDVCSQTIADLKAKLAKVTQELKTLKSSKISQTQRPHTGQTAGMQQDAQTMPNNLPSIDQQGQNTVANDQLNYVAEIAEESEPTHNTQICPTAQNPKPRRDADSNQENVTIAMATDDETGDVRQEVNDIKHLIQKQNEILASDMDGFMGWTKTLLEEEAKVMADVNLRLTNNLTDANDAQDDILDKSAIKRLKEEERVLQRDLEKNGQIVEQAMAMARTAHNTNANKIIKQLNRYENILNKMPMTANRQIVDYADRERTLTARRSQSQIQFSQNWERNLLSGRDEAMELDGTALPPIGPVRSKSDILPGTTKHNAANGLKDISFRPAAPATFAGIPKSGPIMLTTNQFAFNMPNGKSQGMLGQEIFQKKKIKPAPLNYTKMKNLQKSLIQKDPLSTIVKGQEVGPRGTKWRGLQKYELPDDYFSDYTVHDLENRIEQYAERRKAENRLYIIQNIDDLLHQSELQPLDDLITTDQPAQTQEQLSHWQPLKSLTKKNTHREQ